MSDNIDLFLEKVGLTKYRDSFRKDGTCRVRDVSEFRRFIKDHYRLKKTVGMSTLEVKRFIRLCGSTLQDIIPKDARVVSQSNKHLTSTSRNSLPLEPVSDIKNCVRIEKLNCKFLNREGIICDKIYPVQILPSSKYYEFVASVHRVLYQEMKKRKFASVELYSETGYPLATAPTVYLQPLSNWRFQPNELIYAYPKNLVREKDFVSGLGCESFVIKIQHKNSEFIKEFRFNKERVFVIDLKILLALELHIHIDYITILYFSNSKNSDQIGPDNQGFSKDSAKRSKLSFTISDNYEDNGFLSAFHTDYTCYKLGPPQDFNTFNAYLLYLAREHQEDGDKDKFLRKLGLLRKISCSPPLVYALYLLFIEFSISFPHRIAINEGSITTISLLSNRSDHNISEFPKLWLYIEKHSQNPDLLITEIYEQTFISKRTRENPRDDETRRLLQAFPPTQDHFITWRNAPSTHDAFSYTLLNCLSDFTKGVKLRFPIEHHFQLYVRFLECGRSYGLMLPLIDGLASPNVFLGQNQERYGFFKYFSPEDGKCHSYNPHDISISKPFEVTHVNSYPKILIVLDISNDMNTSFLEKSISPKEPNLVSSQLDAAFLLIEMFMDNLIGSQRICKYLLEAIVISNNHEFPDGYQVIQTLTFEYSLILERIKNVINNYKPGIKSNPTRYPNGIILNVFKYLIDLYPSQKKESKTEIFLFTNGETSVKYYGAMISSFEQRMHNSACVVNNVIMSKDYGHELEKLSKQTKGVHVNSKLLSKCVRNVPLCDIQLHPILDYLTLIQDMLSGSSISDDNFEMHKKARRELAAKLMSIEQFLDISQRDKKEFRKASLSQGTCTNFNHVQILRKITAYIKSPNPYCKVFSSRNEILKLIVSMKGPVNSPFEGSTFILEMDLEENYPLYPPKLRFLFPIFHPNVNKAGNVCHPILFEDYQQGVTFRQILDSIHSMLSQPIISHAIRHKLIEIALWHESFYNKISYYLCKRLKDTSVEQDFRMISDSASESHPAALVCPLTNQLFDTPVMTPKGNTYERHAILQYIRRSRKDPISKTPLLATNLIPNRAIGDAVLKHKRTVFAKTYWWDE